MCQNEGFKQVSQMSAIVASLVSANDTGEVETVARQKSTKTALLILSEGAEEIETVVPVDLLRRGGVNVTVAGLTGCDPVACSRQVFIKPDISLKEAAKKGPYDVIILPGGLKGAQSLAESVEVKNLLEAQVKSNGFIAAICAGPLALKSHKVSEHKTVTSHPSVKDDLLQGSTFKYSEERVVQDGKIITSRAPGTSFEFGLTILENLLGKEKAQEVAKPLLLK